MKIKAIFRKAIIWLGHNWPISKGLSRITNLPLVVWALTGDGDLVAKFRFGSKILVDPADFNGRMVAVFGIVEPGITQICQSRLNSETTFLDIGANHGAVGLTCGANRACKVHLFEPQPKLASRIRGAIGDLDANVLSIALGDKDGTFPLLLSEQHSGAGMLVQAADKNTIQVQMREAKQFLRELVGDSPFSAKVDVEGAEFPILKALASMQNLQWMVFECNHDDPSSVWHLFGGMKMYGIREGWRRPTLVPIVGVDQMKWFTDFFVER